MQLPARFASCFAVFVLSTACGSGSKAPDDKTTAKAAEKSASPDEALTPKKAEGEKHVGDLDDAVLAKLRADAQQVTKHLTEARSKAASEDWKGAAESYAKAAEIDDDNPRILGELGWVLFELDDLEGAEHNLRLALRYEQVTKKRAEWLYKLGRVEEAAGDFVEAKKHYDHSLRLDAQAETRVHDEAVGDKAAAACAGGKCTKPDYVDLKEACAAMVARVHEQLALQPHEADGAFTCDPDKAQKIALNGGEATEAAILVVEGEHAGIGEEEHDLLAHIDGGWHWVGTLLDVENPHHGGIARTGAVESFEARELIPNSPGEEILAEVAFAETDVDTDDNLLYHDEHEAFIVCAIAKGRHACHETPSRMFYEAESLDETKPVAHEVESHAFTAKVEFDGKGNVTVTGEGEIPEAEKGTHAITELPEPEGFVFLHDD
jgi:Tfp pilus assembly protein PilF